MKKRIPALFLTAMLIISSCSIDEPSSVEKSLAASADTEQEGSLLLDKSEYYENFGRYFCVPSETGYTEYRLFVQIPENAAETVSLEDDELMDYKLVAYNLFYKLGASGLSYLDAYSYVNLTQDTIQLNDFTYTRVDDIRYPDLKSLTDDFYSIFSKNVEIEEAEWIEHLGHLWRRDGAVGNFEEYSFEVLDISDITDTSFTATINIYENTNFDSAYELTSNDQFNKALAEVNGDSEYTKPSRYSFGVECSTMSVPFVLEDDGWKINELIYYINLF